MSPCEFKVEGEGCHLWNQYQACWGIDAGNLRPGPRVLNKDTSANMWHREFSYTGWTQIALIPGVPGDYVLPKIKAGDFGWMHLYLQLYTTGPVGGPRLTRP